MRVVGLLLVAASTALNCTVVQFSGSTSPTAWAGCLDENAEIRWAGATVSGAAGVLGALDKYCAVGCRPLSLAIAWDAPAGRARGHERLLCGDETHDYRWTATAEGRLTSVHLRFEPPPT